MEIACQFRRIDVIVNNAGITGCAGPVDSTPHAHDPENTELSDWRAVNAVNSDGTFLGCRCAMRAMRENGGGSIINISSRSGLVGSRCCGLCLIQSGSSQPHQERRSLLRQSDLNIRCNSIHPAAVMTPMWKPMLGTGPDHEDREAALVRDTPRYANFIRPSAQR
ncbi:NAD(P)-dependent dehydrogenase (short-subunit alcohol dehydrogenase family) [Agrobacterium rubi]|nr:NAD(P)-dependent dehydrogenase (short-subunit alcohol dehydrogenase family) [Agrobacterium rubi]